jgi:capsular exopolysaccharide synthesis family protein
MMARALTSLDGDVVEFREVLAALRATWWLPLLGILAGGGVAVGVSLLQTPLYTSSTQLFVSTTAATSTSDVLSGSQFSQQRVTSYAQLLTGEQLAGRVIDRLGLTMTPKRLAQEIGATAVPDTVLIDVTVTDPSPSQAQRIAEAVGSEFGAMSAQLERVNANGVSPVKVTVTQAPDLPTTASSPRLLLNLAVGLLLGLLLGVGVAIARARLDRTVKDPEEAAELARTSVIGTVLRDQALEKRHTIDRGAGSRTAEDYRQLRTNLQFLSVDEPPKVIMVSSAIPAEGKTTVVINLAIALVDAGRRVVVLEADLRRPKVTSYLGMVGDVGLTNVLAGNAGIDDVGQNYREGLTVIAAGPLPPNPGELLASGHMAALIDKLRGEYDYVLIDAPPLLPIADSSGLAAHTDGVLLTVRYGSTRKDQLRQAATTLHRVGARTLGVVLNIVAPKADVATAYGYGYAYESKHAKP